MLGSRLIYFLILRFLIFAGISVGVNLGTSSTVLAFASKSPRPCTEGGQPPRDDGKVGKGNKQCEQIKDSSGKFLNHGRYIEWFPSGKRALEGEYTAGAKTGKWMEWDESGKLLYEKWFENGTEVPGREEKPYNGLTPQPRATPTSRKVL